MGSLLAARGYGRLHAQAALEAAWEQAVDEPTRNQTRLGGLHRGVLSITVTHPTLLEELAAFQKPRILAALRQALPDATIRDLKFRVGPID